MRRRFLIIGGLFCVGVFVVWCLWGGHFVGGLAEELLEEVSGGEVDIAETSVSLTGGRLMFKGIAISDRHNPHRNMIEADEAVFSLSPAALLKGRLYVEEVCLSGVRFGTERKYEEKIKNQKKEPSSKKSPKKVKEEDDFWRGVERWLKEKLSELPLSQPQRLVAEFDPREIINRGEVKSLDLLKRWEKEFCERRRDIEEEMKRLSDKATVLEERFEKLRKRYKKLRKKREILSAIKETNSLMKEAKTLIKSADKLKRKATSMGNFSGLRKDFEETLEEDIKKLRERYTFGGFKFVKISRFLFGERMVDLAHRVWWWGRLLWRYIPRRPRSTTLSGTGWYSGVKVRFKGSEKQPWLIIKKALLDVDLSESERLPKEIRGRYRVSVYDISSAPKLYGRPIVFNFLGSPSYGGRVEVSFRIVAEEPQRTVGVTARASGLPMKAFKFGARNLRFLGKGSVDLHIKGTLFENGCRLRMEAEVKDVEIKPLGDVKQGMIVIISDVMRRVRDFRLSVDVEVVGDRVCVDVTSDIDRKLKDAFQAKFHKEFKAARSRFEKQLKHLLRKKLEETIKTATQKTRNTLLRSDKLSERFASFEKVLKGLLKSLEKKAAKSFLERLIK